MFCLRPQNLHTRRSFLQKRSQRVLLQTGVTDGPGSLPRLLPAVTEDQDLVLAGVLHGLVVHDVVHHRVPLHRLLLRDPDKLLLQRHGTEAVVKVEQPGLGVDPQEHSHVLVVGQSGGEPHQPDLLLGGLDVPDAPGHQGLQHWASLVMEQVDLVEDDQPDQLSVGPLASLPRDDVPLLRGADNHLGLVDLLLAQLAVSCQLGHCQPVFLKTLAEASGHFSTK